MQIVVGAAWAGIWAPHERVRINSVRNKYQAKEKTMPKFRRTRNATQSTDQHGLTITFEVPCRLCQTFHNHDEKCPTETNTPDQKQSKQSQK